MTKKRSYAFGLVVALVAALAVVAGPQLASAVTQDGPNNFAGPAAQCPGAGWDCTTNTTNLTQTTDDGQNVVHCAAATCDVTQISNTGTNRVRCAQSMTANGTQRCTYDQQNAGGQNIAEVTQSAVLNKSLSIRLNIAGVVNAVNQTSTQRIDGTQTNTTGSNVLDVAQTIRHATSGLVTVADTQLARQFVESEQTSGSGDQSANIDQTETLTQSGLGLGATQKQNADGEGPNTSADVTQKTQSGDNSASVDQVETLTQSATSIAGNVAQTQGLQDDGGESLVWDVDSVSGNSHVVSNQTKTWTQSATHLLPVGTTTQKQLDRLGILGLPFTTHTSEVHQKTDLVADPGAQQVCLQAVDIYNKVNGTATQNCTLDDGTPTTTTEETSGTHVQSTNECTSADCDPSDDPDGSLHKAVRNAGTEGGFDGPEAPSSAEAAPGDVVEYQLTYENTGGGPASDVVISDAAPPNTSFVSCSDECNQEGDVSWNVGTVEPEESVVRTFRVEVNEGVSPGTNIPNVASASSSAGGASSNQVNVTVTEAATTGAISGTVTDAQNPDQAIEGVVVQTGDDSDTTDANGNYELAGLAPGHYTVQASKEGYSTTQLETDVTAGQTSDLDFSLSAAGESDEYRIVLTWGADPGDLDSHLWLPSDTPYHVFYSRKGTTDGCPNASLDVDDTDGGGPETVTIVDPFAGTYRYAIHKFTAGGGPLKNSNAVVQLYRGDDLLQTFNVPTTGTGADNWWHVFDLDAQSGTVTAVNQLLPGSTGSDGNNTQPPAPYADTSSGCPSLASFAPAPADEGSEKTG